MTGDIVRWGVLGTARVNQLVLPAIQASPRSRLLALASRDAGRAADHAARWGMARAYPAYAALLVDHEIDAVYIALPNSLHAEWTLRAIRAGKHVLCEKPLALTARDVDTIAAAAAATGVVVAEAVMYRYHPQTLRVQELLASGAIGPVRLMLSWFTVQVADEGEARMLPELGGGCLWNLGVYPISYLRLVAGAEPIECRGMEQRGATGVDEDYVGQLRFPGDIYGQFHASFRMPRRMHLEIVGRDGVMTVAQPFKPGVEERILIRRGNDVETVTVTGAELYRPEIEDFVDAVTLGRPSRVSLADTRGTVATIEALLRV
jgi:xylose dehydrogenase (NAD/NADP)